MDSIRPTRTIIDLGAIAFNIRSLRGHVGRGPLLMAVVKADGYGHGIVPIAQTAIKAGADWLGVALLEEAIVLRDTGIDLPILVLGETIPKGAGLYVEKDVSATVCSEESLLALDQAAGLADRKANIHIKVDTGMGRIGIKAEEVVSFVERALSLKNIQIEGIFSHFACADEEDKTYSYYQLDRFKGAIEALEMRGVKIPLKHLAGSAGTIDLPESHFDMVRPGISIYGAHPSPYTDHSVSLRPAMTFKTEIVFVKELPPGSGISYGIT